MTNVNGVEENYYFSLTEGLKKLTYQADVSKLKCKMHFKVKLNFGIISYFGSSTVPSH